MKLRVGMDIDGTMFDIEPGWTEEYVSNGHEHQIKAGGGKSLFDTWEKPKEICLQCYRYCVDSTWLYKSGVPYEGMSEGLNFVTTYGDVEIVYVTHRPEWFKPFVQELLTQHGCPEAPVVCNFQRKSITCAEYELKFLVDDSPETIASLYGSATTPIVYDQCYNQILARGLRVRNWKQVTSVLLALEELQVK